MKLIEEMRASLDMEIRPQSRGSEYLEAVVRKEDLARILPLLTAHLEQCVRGPGPETGLPEDLRKLIEATGGLRPGQSFFYHREEDQTLLFAALWPWESQPGRITLKAGIVSPSKTD